MSVHLQQAERKRGREREREREGERKRVGEREGELNVRIYICIDRDGVKGRERASLINIDIERHREIVC